ncbi:MAG: zinc ribbon domain-containing protein [Clostridiales bacterium]|nr:zinc ribbon domain-containing protein [Clostridiales bacterium]
MALIACPECAKEVSEQAEACPHCGFPVSKYLKEQEKKRRGSRDKRKIQYTDEELQQAINQQREKAESFIQDKEAFERFGRL